MIFIVVFILVKLLGYYMRTVQNIRLKIGYFPTHFHLLGLGSLAQNLKAF